MKALVYVGERQLEVRDVPEPKGEFLVRILGCAICGTDLKTLLHGHPYFKPRCEVFNSAIEKAAGEMGFAVADLFHSRLSNDTYYFNTVDGLHPDEDGMRIIAEVIGDAISIAFAE